MKAFILLYFALFTSFSITARTDEKVTDQTLKKLINKCLESASYYQRASENLGFLVNTDARAYILCSNEPAEELYEYLKKYTKDNVMKHNGEVIHIHRKLSETVYCTNSVDYNTTNCTFDLDIDEDVIEKEEQKQ